MKEECVCKGVCVCVKSEREEQRGSERVGGVTSSGMDPVSLLWDRSRTCSLLREDKQPGMVPVRLFFAMCNSDRLFN